MSQAAKKLSDIHSVQDVGTSTNLSVLPGGENKKNSKKSTDIRYLIRALTKYGASDLHLKVGRPPLYRINGRLVQAKMDAMTSEGMEKVVSDILTSRQIQDLENHYQVDASFRVGKLGRFRCNAFFQRGSLSVIIRMIPIRIPKIEDLGIPVVLKELVQRPRGLILITGPTGSGKSTTLASLIQHINETRHVHVITIEDPIEFVFRDQKSSVTQREVGSDAKSFEDSLYAGLRQDPDVIMIGELRDPQVIQTALTAAETGHLVLTTLHTNDAATSLDRIIDVFPGHAKDHVRIQLASSLVAVVSQHLLNKEDGSGRVPACEVMINSPAIENYIRKGEFERIPEAIANSNDYYHMQTLNQDLKRLIASGQISLDEGLKVTPNPDDLRLALSGVDHKEGYEIVSEENPRKTRFS